MGAEDDLEQLSKKELKDRLRDADEAVSGTKAELVDRLRRLSDGEDAAADNASSGDDSADGSSATEVSDESNGESDDPATGSWSDHLERVRSTIRQLTSHDVDSFVGVSALDDGAGWSYTVQLTEARRVPATADLVALYRVDVRSDGELAALEQIGRGRRDQVTTR